MKNSKKLKYFLMLVLVSASQMLFAQCPKGEIYFLDWEGKSLTVKWHCNPKPLKGKFYIFRACLSDSKVETLIDSVLAFKKYEYSDNDKQLKTNLIYRYRLQYENNKNCSFNLNTQGKVIDGDTGTIGFTKNINAFIQKDIVKITPSVLNAKTDSYIKVRLEIKDFKYNFSSKLKYTLICDDVVFETISENIDDDFRFSRVFILEKARIYQKCRIALIQESEMIGISPEIQIE